MRYYDVKLEKKYITIVIVDGSQEVRKKIMKIQTYELKIRFRNRKYISIRVWKLRKEISGVEIEEYMNLDTDVQECIENF